MSYYIRPQPTKLSEAGEIAVYRVVKRLKDFTPNDGEKYIVFKSKQEMKNSLLVPVYIGKNGKLKKHAVEFVLRF